MTEMLTKTYEGMFLFDASKTDAKAATEAIENVLKRSEGEVLSLNSWDERRLAYEIKGASRGLYMLTYFKADPEKIQDIERDCQLGEEILRVMILRRDTISDDELKAETPAQVDARKAAEAAEAAEAEEATKAAEVQAEAAPAAEEAPAAAEQEEAAEAQTNE